MPHSSGEVAKSAVVPETDRGIIILCIGTSTGLVTLLNQVRLCTRWTNLLFRGGCIWLSIFSYKLRELFGLEDTPFPVLLIILSKPVLTPSFR